MHNVAVEADVAPEPTMPESIGHRGAHAACSNFGRRRKQGADSGRICSREPGPEPAEHAGAARGEQAAAAEGRGALALEPERWRTGGG